MTMPSVPTGVRTAVSPETGPGFMSSPTPGSSIGVRYAFTCFEISRPSGSKTSPMLTASGVVAS